MSPVPKTNSVQLPTLLAAIAKDELRLQILEGLPDFGWRVLTASKGDEILSLVSQHAPDGLLIDIEMADCAATVIRSLSILRAALVPPEDTEKQLALLRDLKVNACINLPLQIELLAVSLDSLLRLSSPSNAGDSHLVKPRTREKMEPWSLSKATWTLSPADHAAVTLIQSETTFLATLAESQGKPVSRPQMIAALGHNVDYYDSRRLDTMVSRLRTKVHRVCACDLPVRSIHSIGYAFVAPIVVEE